MESDNGFLIKSPFPWPKPPKEKQMEYEVEIGNKVYSVSKRPVIKRDSNGVTIKVMTGEEIEFSALVPWGETIVIKRRRHAT